jgi:branched-chain amino acid transport system ATP-binding protein
VTLAPNAAATNPAGASPLLRLESVAVAFGGLRALDEVDLEVDVGERVAILGPNGAGKTTLFNAIAGDFAPTEGRVLIHGVDCTHLPSRLRPQLGFARTYQTTRLFGGLSVQDNLYLAQTGYRGRHFSMRRTRLDRRLQDEARSLAERVWLASELDTMVADLSHGQQRQLEIGLAVANRPQLLMLDEPASGLSRGERERLVVLLENLPEETAVLLIEHDMDVALRVAARVVVMAAGRTVATGTPAEIRENSIVHAVYLGERG